MSLDCTEPVATAVLDRPAAEFPRPCNAPADGDLIAETTFDDESSAPAPVVPTPAVATTSRARGPVADWIELTKPRIVTMILVTTVASAAIAASVSPTGLLLSPLQWLVLLLGTAMVAGSAGAANQIWERQIDRRMPRTARRPLPGQRISALVATVVMLGSLVGGSALLVWQVGTMPAIIGVATWVLYVLIYTPMKVRTSFNTTIGAVAGALPILIGYTAAGGQTWQLAGWMLLGILTFWQYPHFMAIAWLYRRQYGEAGFVMTTTIEPTGRSAAWQSVLGTIAMVGCGVGLTIAPRGDFDPSWIGVVASCLVVAAGYPLFRSAIRFQAAPGDALARTMMRWSLVVLPMILLIVTLRAACFV